MSRLDNFEEILKSYDERDGGIVLLHDKPLLKRDYNALKAVLKPSGVLPENISQIKSLLCIENDRAVRFWLENCSLPCLAPEIGKLDGLQILSCEGMLMQELPETIGSLVNLEILNLAANELYSLPESMKNMRSLASIDISRNQFKSMPAVLLELPKLREVYCKKNFINFENDPVMKKLRENGVMLTNEN